MFSVQSSCFLLVSLLFSATATGAEQVITASRGETVLLPCPSPYDYRDTVSVEWKKDGESSVCRYRMSNNRTSDHACNNPRFKVNADPVGLLITDVTGSDAAVYNCSVIRMIPPPAVEDFAILILQVNVPAGLMVQQVNISNQRCVELLCSLEGLSPEQVKFTWSRGSEQLLHQSNPSNMSSTLTLCKPHWRGGDTFTCQASYSSDRTLYSKSITIKSSNKEGTETSWLLIGSAIGGSVGVLFILLLCVVIYKCKKKEDTSDPIVFSNKVYENLTSFTPRATAEPGAGLNTRTNPRPDPQGANQTQREECIYEN
ncbi:hypothetical protein AOLI_G00222730 [Acnodon oligacanthus]